MSETYTVSNHEELGNAIWSSKPGDTINLLDGKYGFLPIKDGVNYNFFDNASVECIFNTELNGNIYINGEVKFGNSTFKSPRLQKNNISMYYLYRKKLPFNSRFKNSTIFIHPNGVLICVLNEVLSNGFSIPEPEGLHCDYAEILVPSFFNYDVALANNYSIENIDTAIEQRTKRDAIEAQNNDIEMALNDLEYWALWALNDFIKEYARLFDQIQSEVFSISAFTYGLECFISYDLEQPPASGSNSYRIRKFSGEVNMEKALSLQNSLLSIQDFSLSDFVQQNLEKLNYQAAVIGMYQIFEEVWERAVPNKEDKWKFIERNTSDNRIKKNLAEMINARNWIAHHRVLKTENKVDSKGNNKLKVDWNAQALNQFQIFYRKKPWEWNIALKDFLLILNS